MSVVFFDGELDGPSALSDEFRNCAEVSGIVINLVYFTLCIRKSIYFVFWCLIKVGYSFTNL